MTQKQLQAKRNKKAAKRKAVVARKSRTRQHRTDLINKLISSSALKEHLTHNHN